ncbi:helix-turn-helix transcriptional regulator [Gottfriedia sp. NPDC058432]|uniref:helix-turn-helix transcriptional regulator n=1 Tax=Gottfriedia sp. NPDC058432 TaxID=3346497 RepID=UPI003646E851
MKNNIKDLRETRGISQEKLANMLDVSRQTIISIEKGKFNPSLQLAFKFSKVFSLSIEEIFQPEEE